MDAVAETVNTMKMSHVSKFRRKTSQSFSQSSTPAVHTPSKGERWRWNYGKNVWLVVQFKNWSLCSSGCINWCRLTMWKISSEGA